MKPHLLLAGIPAFTTRQRDRDFQRWFESADSFPNWYARLVWAESKEVTLHACWRKVETELASLEQNSIANGVHLLLFHKDKEERGQFMSRIGSYQRCRFLPTKSLSEFGTEAFYDLIRTEASTEEQWRRKIRPDALNHPLFLPGEYFATTPYLSEVWDRARLTESLADIDNLSGALLEFIQKHVPNGLQYSAFVDLKQNHFKLPKAVDYHGMAADERENWKFTYRMPEGFHFDVCPPTGRGRFMVRTPVGEKEFVDRVNIYPHGRLR